jgi:hypothetical protein
MEGAILSKMASVRTWGRSGRSGRGGNGESRKEWDEVRGGKGGQASERGKVSTLSLSLSEGLFSWQEMPRIPRGPHRRISHISLHIAPTAIAKIFDALVSYVPKVAGGWNRLKDAILRPIKDWDEERNALCYFGIPNLHPIDILSTV